MLKSYRAGEELGIGFVNQVSEWINGFRITSDGSIMCSKIDNQFRLVASSGVFNGYVLQTADDGSGYPTAFSGNNVYYAYVCSASTPLTSIGYNVLSPNVGSGVYFFNMGNAFIHESSYVMAIALGSLYIVRYNGSEVLYGTASGGPGSVSMSVSASMQYVPATGWTVKNVEGSVPVTFPFAIKGGNVSAINRYGWDQNAQPIATTGVQKC